MAKTAENDDGSAIISADTPSFSNLMQAINSRIYLLLIASIRFENDGVSAEIIALPIHKCAYYYNKHYIQYIFLKKYVSTNILESSIHIFDSVLG